MDRILVIDDDTGLCELLSEYLSGEGFEVHTANDGLLGIEKAVSGGYDLIVLDVMLPGCNGFEALRRIRSLIHTPVIMLTARGDDVDRIVGLEIGADDYLSKPFNPRELVARIRAIQRRAGQAAPAKEPGAQAQAGQGRRIAVGDLQIDGETRTVTRSGSLVELTAIEFELLDVLMRSAGKIVSRKDLFKDAFGRGYSTFDRSVDVHVSSLRKKLGNWPDGIEMIKTVRGVGYIFTRPSI